LTSTLDAPQVLAVAAAAAAAASAAAAAVVGSAVAAAAAALVAEARKCHGFFCLVSSLAAPSLLRSTFGSFGTVHVFELPVDDVCLHTFTCR